jgi:CheY-like chemotaxis protein
MGYSPHSNGGGTIQEYSMPERAVILIVDDNEADQMFIRRAFTKARVLNTLIAIRTGEEAVAYLRGTGQYTNRAECPLPDLVLLDLKLSGISGFEVLMWIRQQPELKALRVVVLTGSNAIEDINLANQLGANGILMKPLDFENFVQVAGFVKVGGMMEGYWLWMDENPDVSRPREVEVEIPKAA